jgi:hypothetical protein
MNKKRNRASNHASRVSHDGDTMGYRLMETDQITISIRAPSPPYAESQHWTPMRVMKHSHWPSIISSEAAVTLKCEFWEPPPNLKGVPIMTEFGRVDVKRFVYLEVQRVCGRPVSLAVPVYEGPLPKILDNYQMALGVSAQMQLDRDSWVPQQSAVASTPTRLAPVSSTKSRSVSVDMQNRNRHRTSLSTRGINKIC